MAVLGAALVIVLACNPDLLPLLPVVDALGLDVLMLLLAAAITWRSWSWVAITLLAWGLMLLTAPVSAHVVGRAGYRTKHMRADLLTEDELAAAVDRVGREPGPRSEVDDR